MKETLSIPEKQANCLKAPFSASGWPAIRDGDDWVSRYIAV